MPVRERQRETNEALWRKQVSWNKKHMKNGIAGSQIEMVEREKNRNRKHTKITTTQLWNRNMKQWTTQLKDQNNKWKTKTLAA